MRNQKLSTLLASAAILGSSMVGCSGASLSHRTAIAAAAPVGGIAPRIEEALASKDYAQALSLAEELVAAAPQDGTYRALLGRAYLANGRYSSAQTAFEDAMALGNRDPRTLVSLALCKTGMGDSAGARSFLADHIADMPASDYGLAMAMAGDPREGARALAQAVKMPDATAQTRQNFAYALALAGAYGESRLIAGQDLAARQAEQRVGEWTKAAQGTDASRVAAFIGVMPSASDEGVPQRLALNAPAETSAPVQVAAADPVAAIDGADTEIQAIALGSPEQAPAAAAPVSTGTSRQSMLAAAFEQADADNSPVIRAPSEPMRRAYGAAFVRQASATSLESFATPAEDARASDWVVQLGAYDSEAVAREKWARISKKWTLGEFNEIHSAFSLNGHDFHRLAIRGFTDQKTAYSMCASLRADGQACFVRLDDTNATRMARAEALKQGERLATAQKPKAGVQLATR